MFKTCLRQDGVTLIETVIGLVIIAVITLAAAPVMSSLINRGQINSDRSALAQDIRLMRRLAMSHRHPAYLCGLGSAHHCAEDGRWNHGWIGFIDRNSNHVLDAADDVLLEFSRPAVQNVEIFLHARWPRLKFDTDGTLRSSGHFRICDSALKGPQDQDVIRMNAHGRMAIERDHLICG